MGRGSTVRSQWWRERSGPSTGQPSRQARHKSSGGIALTAAAGPALSAKTADTPRPGPCTIEPAADGNRVVAPVYPTGGSIRTRIEVRDHGYFRLRLSTTPFMGKTIGPAGCLCGEAEQDQGRPLRPPCILWRSTQQFTAGRFVLRGSRDFAICSVSIPNGTAVGISI